MQGSRLVAAAVSVVLMGLALPVYADPAGPATDASLTAEIVEIARVLLGSFLDWLQRGYTTMPAVIIGLAALVVLPLLALFGLLLRRTPDVENRPPTEVLPVMPRDAWLEIEGEQGSRHRIGAGMLRIGRQDDNDLCIDHSTVHRYHAVVYRSPDTGFIIMDVGGRDGNGIKLNDVPVAQATLQPGDRLLLGKVQLRFGAADL